MGRSAKESESLVFKIVFVPSSILSTARHVKSRRNLGGPSPNPKYSLVTDSAVSYTHLVQELLSANYQNEQFSIYIKQLSTGKEAGINENKKMYAASVMKLPYLYSVQEKINQGDYQLDTKLKYVSEVNDFPGSYKPEGSGRCV